MIRHVGSCDVGMTSMTLRKQFLERGRRNASVYERVQLDKKVEIRYRNCLWIEGINFSICQNNALSTAYYTNKASGIRTCELQRREDQALGLRCVT